MHSVASTRSATLTALSDSPIASSVMSAADIVLFLDANGIIREVALGETIEPHPAWNDLVGERWSETLTKECQSKVEQLLQEAWTGKKPRSRELNQIAEGLGEIPLRFNAVLLDDPKGVVAVGRDLRPVAALQQQLVKSQQKRDIELARIRQADVRYRVFFQAASEGVVIAEAASGRIVEVNRAAASMLGEPASAFRDKTLEKLFQPVSWSSVRALLAAVEAGGRPGDAVARLAGKPGQDSTVSLTAFRQSGSPMVLLRLVPAAASGAQPRTRPSTMLAVVEALPDAFVVTDGNGRILCANKAFSQLVRTGQENLIVGEPIDRWLGRPGMAFGALVKSLKDAGVVRDVTMNIRGDWGPDQLVLVTAVSALKETAPCIGVIVRQARSPRSDAPTPFVTARSIEQLRELVGRVPLKELRRESIDLIEKLCIETALDVSGNNRAAAAQLLGLSRQSLYSKLGRYGLGDLGSE